MSAPVTNRPLEKVFTYEGPVTLPGEDFSVKRYSHVFRSCNLPPTQKDALDKYHHHKPFVEGAHGPVFAEIALIELLEKQGWNARWIDNYRNKVWHDMPRKESEDGLPMRELLLYAKIRSAMGRTRGGCWDIWAWRGNRHLFIEAKWRGHDRPKADQARWLGTATRLGVPKRSFWLVEWDYPTAVGRGGSGSKAVVRRARRGTKPRPA